MNRQLVRKARQLWDVEGVPAEINRANRRKWIRSVHQLGSKWLLAVPVERSHAKAA